jgi:hypothetical protein
MDPENEDNYKGDASTGSESIRKFTKQNAPKQSRVKEILSKEFKLQVSDKPTNAMNNGS